MAKKKTAKKVSSKTRAASKAGVAAPKKELTAAQKAAQVKREIAKRNKLFAAADAAGKRVLIAKDVIAQIKLGKFNPVTGSWVDAIDYRYNVFAAAGYNLENPSPTMPRPDINEESRSVREDFFAGLTGTCNCCALGAMFMSCTLNNNKTTMADLDEVQYALGDRIEDRAKDGPMSNGLTKFFSFAQLKLIEQAYECGNGGWGIDLWIDPKTKSNLIERRQPTPTEAKILAWRNKYPNDAERLVAIMTNIVKNNGTFVV